MSYPNSLSKNISSPSLPGNYSINPSQGTPNNNIQNINNVLQNPKEINEMKEEKIKIFKKNMKIELIKVKLLLSKKMMK